MSLQEQGPAQWVGHTLILPELTLCADVTWTTATTFLTTKSSAGADQLRLQSAYKAFKSLQKQQQEIVGVGWVSSQVLDRMTQPHQRDWRDSDWNYAPDSEQPGGAQPSGRYYPDPPIAQRSNFPPAYPEGHAPQAPTTAAPADPGRPTVLYQNNTFALTWGSNFPDHVKVRKYINFWPLRFVAGAQFDRRNRYFTYGASCRVGQPPCCKSRWLLFLLASLRWLVRQFDVGYLPIRTPL